MGVFLRRLFWLKGSLQSEAYHNSPANSYNVLETDQEIGLASIPRGRKAKMVERRRTRAKKAVAKSNRTPTLYLLGLAILASFSAFVYWITRTDRVGAHVTSVSIVEYGDRFPRIQKKWASQDITPDEKQARFKQSLLEPKPSGGDRELQNKAGVNELINDLKSSDLDKNLPLVILVRCHAQAIKSEQGYDCNLLTEEDEKQYGKQYLLTELVKQLEEIPSRNIIVLADICDLSFLPSEGIIVNPIATSIRDTCKSLNDSIGDDLKKSDRNIWIMCPSTDGQISHRDREGTTLFQAACRAAFDTNQESVTLSSFYQYVLSHVHTWSAGTQTPLLFSVRPSDQSDHVVLTDDVRLINDDLRLSRYEKPIEKPKPSEESDKKKKGDAETAYRDTEPASPQYSHNVKLVRWVTLQDESAKPNAEKSNSSTNAEAEKPPTTPTTFRDYHESLRTRDPKASWVWHGAQFDALKYRLSLQESVDPEKSASRPKEWDEKDASSKARRAFTNPGLSDSGLSEKIVDYWEHPEKLPPKYKDVWRGTRDRYIQYVVGISEYRFWRNLVVSSKEATYQSDDPIYDESIKSLADQLEALSKSLIQFRAAMPAEDSSGALVAWKKKSQSNDPVDTTTLYQSLKRLVDKLVKRSKDATKKDKGENNKSADASWTAVDESLMQVLAAFPLLDASQRQQLGEVEKSTSDLKNWQLAIGSLPTPEKLKLLLKKVSPSEAAFSPSHWKNKLALESLGVIEELCGFDKPEGSRSSDSITSYNDGQSNLLNRFKNGKQSGGSEDRGNPFIFAINRWHFYHLGEMTRDLKDAANDDRHGVAGIIVSPAPVTDTTISLAGTPNDEKFLELKSIRKVSQFTERSATFGINVEFLGTDANPVSCKLKWELLADDTNGMTPMELRTQKGQVLQPWKRGEFQVLDVTSGQIKCEIRLSSKGSLPLKSILKITKVDDNEELLIPVFTDANRIELVFENEDGRKFFARDNVLELAGPCFQDTKAVYSCYLLNKLPRERSVTVTFCKDKKDKQPLFKSEEERIQPANLQKIQLPPIDGKGATEPFPDVLYAFIQESIEGSPKAESVEPIEIRFKPILPTDDRTQTTWKITTAPSVIGSAAKVEFSILNTPISPAKTTIKLENIEEPGYDKYTGALASLETTKGEPKTLEFPALERDKRYLFAVRIGDYPRALFFEQDPTKEDRKFAEPGRPDRLVVKKITSGENKFSPKDNETIIFPRYKTGTNVPIELINYSSLILDIEADSPDRRVFWSLTPDGLDDRQNETMQRSWPDRTFRPVLDASTGDLSLSFSVSDLKVEIPLAELLSGPEKDKTTSLELRLSLRSELKDGGLLWNNTLLFDREPPNANAKFYKNQKSSSELSEIELSEGAEAKFFINTQDEENGSGLNEARFSFGRDRKTAKELPAKLCAMETSKNGFQCSITVDLKDASWSDHRQGIEEFLYLVTTDKAGNEQHDHPPLTIVWKKPKSTPAAKPQ